MDLPSFIPGLELSDRFFREAVRPLLEEHFPALSYAAARLGTGSDVMGFDTSVSRDHQWGPRVTLFLSGPDLETHAERVHALLGERLPFEFAGYPTHFAHPEVSGGVLAATDRRPIRHGVRTTTLSAFLTGYLGRDVTGPPTAVAWLSFPSQHLFTIASGRVFHDPEGVLHRLRGWLAWYPNDLWLYLMANEWRHIAQEEAFVGRAGDVGDELGSRLVAARLVRRLMRLAFLIERRYAPYTKWFGTAFSRLPRDAALLPLLTAALDAVEWRSRERALGDAYASLGEMHNALGITAPIDAGLRPYFSRPYLVPEADRFVDALLDAIESPEVRALPRFAGSLDQFVDSTDILSEPGLGQRLSAIHRGGG